MSSKEKAPKSDLKEKAKRLETVEAEMKPLNKEFKTLNLRAAKLDEKDTKKLKKLKSTLDAMRKERDQLRADLKPPAKERESKYDYPAGATSDEKKKIRTAARAAAKKALKGEGKAEKKADKKSDKKADKKEAEVVKSPEKKKSKDERKAEKKAAKKSED